jgi:hypothetical protein
MPRGTIGSYVTDGGEVDDPRSAQPRTFGASGYRTRSRETDRSLEVDIGLGVGDLPFGGRGRIGTGRCRGRCSSAIFGVARRAEIALGRRRVAAA